MADAPAGDEGARDRHVGEMDRECIVQDTAHAGGADKRPARAAPAWGHRPTIRAGILIEPLLHPIESLAETSIRYGDPDPYRKPAFGIASRLLRRSHAAAVEFSPADAQKARSRRSRPVISIWPSSVNWRRRTFRSAIDSIRFGEDSRLRDNVVASGSRDLEAGCLSGSTTVTWRG
jgi:hypothetical protein